MDRFSPLAPAHVRVLVLPLEQIERPRFVEFLQRLRNEASIIRLNELDDHTGDRDLLFPPSTFPQGSLLYNYVDSPPSEEQQHYSPFELFREPLVVLGIIDGRDDKGARKEFKSAYAYLRERHPRVVHRQLLVLDSVEEDFPPTASDNVIRIKSVGKDGPVLRDAVCQWSGRFLVELDTYTRALQASPSIQTPGKPVRSLQKNPSFRESARRRESGSGQNTPSHEAQASLGENGTRPPPLPLGTPATSFDQISNGSTQNVPSSRPLSRSNSRGKRASSQDRGSSTTSKEKLKNRGKARVGIIVGSAFMLAGQWSEALKTLVEHTVKSRTFSDHVWHAKGLEHIVACLLLHAWAGVEFEIPSICSSMTERASAQVQRFSTTMSIDPQPGETLQQISLRRLSSLLPDLSKFVLNLYGYGEGNLELPSIILSEVTLRFCKLLAIVYNGNGELEAGLLRAHIGCEGHNEYFEEQKFTPWKSAKNVSRSTIAELLLSAQPPSDEQITVADHAEILSGTAAIYAMIDMTRKRAMIMRELIAVLTTALVQARKRGAAEMGIHPAASLSLDIGADDILAAVHENGGVDRLIHEMSKTYGVELVPHSGVEGDKPTQARFGNGSLKLEILKNLIALCEALPNPSEVIRLSVSVLKTFGPQAVVDHGRDSQLARLSRETQIQYATMIGRTIGLAKNIGLPPIEASYWDAFLVRDVEFLPPGPQLALMDLSRTRNRANSAGSQASTQPLLFNAIASRPSTATEAQPACTLVEGEVAQCVVTLQNPYDFAVDIESLTLISDGVELSTNHHPTLLNPICTQRMVLSVLPRSTGEAKITGCHVKINRCAARTFPIVRKSWVPDTPPRIKEIGQDCLTPSGISKHGEEPSRPKHVSVAISVVSPMPVLTLDDISPSGADLDLLDGEEKVIELKLHNNSSVAASVFDVVTTQDTIRRLPDTDSDDSESGLVSFTEITFLPSETTTLKFTLTGSLTHPNASIHIHHTRHDAPDHTQSRALTIPLTPNVRPALQLLHPTLHPLPPQNQTIDAFNLTFDLHNAASDALAYTCVPTTSAATPNTPAPRATDLAPGATHHITLTLAQLPAHPAPPTNSHLLTQAIWSRLHIPFTRTSSSNPPTKATLPLPPLHLPSSTLHHALAPPIHLHLSLTPPNPTATTHPTPATATQQIPVAAFTTLRATLTNALPTPSGPLVARLRLKSAATGATRTSERSDPGKGGSGPSGATAAVQANAAQLGVQARPQGRSDSDEEDEEERPRVALTGAGRRFVRPLDARRCEGAEAVQGAMLEWVVCPRVRGDVKVEVCVEAGRVGGWERGGGGDGGVDAHADGVGDGGGGSWCARRGFIMHVV